MVALVASSSTADTMFSKSMKCWCAIVGIVENCCEPASAKAQSFASRTSGGAPTVARSLLSTSRLCSSNASKPPSVVSTVEAASPPPSATLPPASPPLEAPLPVDPLDVPLAEAPLEAPLPVDPLEPEELPEPDDPLPALDPDDPLLPVPSPWSLPRDPLDPPLQPMAHTIAHGTRTEPITGFFFAGSPDPSRLAAIMG